MKKHSFFYFICLVLFFFFLDTFTFMLAHKQVVYSLMCLFVIQIVAPFSLLRLIFIMLCIATESLLYYGSFLLPFVYLIPVAYIGYHIATSWYIRPLHRIIFLGIVMLGQMLIVECLFLSLPTSITYTFSKIVATMGILIVLTYFKL